MKISMKLVYQYMAIFFNFPPTSSHLHPLQVDNCDSNSRLVVDEDDNDKFRPERVKMLLTFLIKWEKDNLNFKICSGLGWVPSHFDDLVSKGLTHYVIVPR